jgi:hypothetical protein
MPLRTTTPIPIRVLPAPVTPPGIGPDPPGAGKMNFDAAPAAPNNPLPISPVSQQESQWCWAACVEMVTGFLHAAKTQCEAVTQFPGTKPQGDPKPCADSNRFQAIGCDIDEMGQVWSSVNINFDLIPKPGKPVLHFADLVVEINAQRPIEVGIAWHHGGGHAILIKGYGEIDGKPAVWINDPLGATTMFGPKIQGGEGQMLLKDLREGYGKGRWVSSWINLTLNSPNPGG